MKMLMAACAGLTVFFLLYAFLIKRRPDGGGDVVKKRVQSLQDAAGRQAALDEEMRKSFFHRIISPLLNEVQKILMKFTPRTLYEIAVKKTNAAGGSYKWGVEGFIAYWVTVSGLVVILMLFYLFTTVDPLAKRTALFLIGTAGGLYLPILLINSHIRKRRQQIMRQLPNMLDLLCVSVQAGLSFDGALRRITDRMKGPLIEECVLMMQEIRFGMTRRQALQRLADRCELQEVSLWVAAVVQADKLGVSLGDIMVIQADNMRESRRQQVRKLAQQAPIKMLLPLAVFIFPAIFVVTLVPSLIVMFYSLSGGLGK